MAAASRLTRFLLSPVNWALCQSVKRQHTCKYARTCLHRIVVRKYTVSSFTNNAVMEEGTAPGILRSWDYSFGPDELLSRATRLIEECTVIYDKIGSLKENEVNFDSVLGELAEVHRIFANEACYLRVPRHVSTSKEFRDASSEALRRLNEFEVETGMRRDIFEKLLLLEKMDTSSLSTERKRFLEKMIKLRRRDGLHLEPEVQKQVKDLKNAINDLCIEYSKSITEENTILEFTEEELQGVSEDFIKSLEMVESGKRRVTLKPPHVLPIMKMAVNPETRRKVDFAYNSRCVGENTPRLEKTIALRHKKAELLQYRNHADFATEVLMAKDSANVRRFLTELADKLQPLWQKEKERLLKYKEEECKLRNLPYDGKLYTWDVSYYKNLVEERIYKVDHEKLKVYFPLDVVTKGLFQIYETLLGLKFEAIKDAKLWHPEALLFSATDAATKTLLGYFAMDMFPREGKYSHFCNTGMQPTCLLPDGSRQLPVVAILCNFPKPTDDKPSLLTHRDVTTYFHEFGHTMHHICSNSKLTYFNMSSVERDFIECPSQMLENWTWELETLRLMSGHYSTGESLPQELGETLAASRLANVAHFNLRQAHLALFDLTLHSQAEVNN